MSEYPKLEFRCSQEMDEEIFSLLAQREFLELEISKSALLKKSILLGLQILKANPSLIQHINEQDFVKDYNSK